MRSRQLSLGVVLLGHLGHLGEQAPQGLQGNEARQVQLGHLDRLGVRACGLARKACVATLGLQEWMACEAPQARVARMVGMAGRGLRVLVGRSGQGGPKGLQVRSE